MASPFGYGLDNLIEGVEMIFNAIVSSGSSEKGDDFDPMKDEIIDEDEE